MVSGEWSEPVPSACPLAFRRSPLTTHYSPMNMITPELIREHGLSDEEYDRIKQLLGREPSFVELGATTSVFGWDPI